MHRKVDRCAVSAPCLCVFTCSLEYPPAPPATAARPLLLAGAVLSAEMLCEHSYCSPSRVERGGSGEVKIQTQTHPELLLAQFSYMYCCVSTATAGLTQLH
jgi:hypothetical protein